MCFRGPPVPHAVNEWPSFLAERSEEHTSELQSPIDISYAVFCLKKKNHEHEQRFPAMGGGSKRAHPLSLPRLPLSIAPDSSVYPGTSLYSFFFTDPATTAIYTSIDTLSLHDALPISSEQRRSGRDVRRTKQWTGPFCSWRSEEHTSELQSPIDISYAVFCLKKKK